MKPVREEDEINITKGDSDNTFPTSKNTILFNPYPCSKSNHAVVVI